MTINVPPANVIQVEAQKVEAQFGEDGTNITLSLIFPHEVTKNLDNKRGLILRNVFVELQKIANELNTTFGLDKPNILERLFGK